MGARASVDRGAGVRAAFARQAELCDMLGSPFTATLCRLCATRLDTTTLVGRHILDWRGDPAADALPLRLAGGLHVLVLADQDTNLAAAYPPHPLDAETIWSAVSPALVRHGERLVDTLRFAPQTNEVARSAILLPGFLAVARATGRPLNLVEIGTSAGLNLLWDRFAYLYGTRAWGDALSPVTLTPALHGQEPDLGGDARILDRRGVDLAPIRVSEPDERLRLRSYVWADQHERRARLDGALALAMRAPPRIEAGDAGVWLDAALQARPDDVATVVFHSIVWQYLPPQTQRHIDATLARHGGAATRRRPLAWLQFEGFAGQGPAVLRLTMWPTGQTQVLAEADFHGRWLNWYG